MSQIEFTQGETVIIDLTLTDALDAPIDITGDSFDFEIKALEDLTTSLASFTFTITDGPNGKVQFILDDVSSAAVPHTVTYTTKGTESPTPLQILLYNALRTRASDGYKRYVAKGLVKVYPS